MRKRNSSRGPTIADVAARAGVGAITVSRALRNPSQVSPLLRKAIDAAVRELNYVPNLNARALASARSNVVAVLVPSLTQNIFTDVLRGVHDGAEGSGLRVEVYNTRYDPLTEERQVFEILRHAPSAIIVSGIDQTPTAREQLEGANCPVVQIMDIHERPIDRIIGFSHHAAGKAMTRHLIEAGYRRIGFFSGWMNSRSQGRLTGYREALEEAGLFDPALITQIGTDEEVFGEIERTEEHSHSKPVMGRELLGIALAKTPDLDAVFCNNDVLALGVLFECYARSIEVPRFGIAGYNDIEVMAAAHPSLTSLRTYRWRNGYDALLSIRAELEGNEPGERIVDIGFEVVQRASTARQFR